MTYVRYGFLVSCFAVMGMLTAGESVISAVEALGVADSAADSIVLSREQAIKIMRVLEQVIDTYSKDATLDLVGDGARAALSCCGQLEDLTLCVLALKAKIDALTVLVSTNDQIEISLIENLSGQVSVNDALLLSQMLLLESCCEALNASLTDFQVSVNNQFNTVNSKIDSFETNVTTEFNTVNTNISNAVTNLSSQNDVLCTKILNAQADIDTRIDNLSIKLSSVQTDLGTKIDQILLCTCAPTP